MVQLGRHTFIELTAQKKAIWSIYAGHKEWTNLFLPTSLYPKRLFLDPKNVVGPCPFSQWIPSPHFSLGAKKTPQPYRARVRSLSLGLKDWSLRSQLQSCTAVWEKPGWDWKTAKSESIQVHSFKCQVTLAYIASGGCALLPEHVLGLCRK